MKVLIVAETEYVIQTFSSFFTSLGYDVIKYHWLMKALDNAEEIDPQIVVICASDYPRHWKTFVQFLKSSICTTFPEIILYSSTNFNQDEKDKISVLGVKNIVLSETEKNDFDKLSLCYSNKKTDDIETVSVSDALIKNENINESEISKNENINESEISKNETDFQEISSDSFLKPQLELPKDIISEYVKEVEITDIRQIKNFESGITKFIFTLPNTNEIINGKVLKFDFPTLIFLPAKESVLKEVKVGQVIDFCTIKTGNFFEIIRAQIRTISDTIEFCLLK